MSLIAWRQGAHRRPSRASSHPDFNRRSRSSTRSTNSRWVADYHRRLGISPTPEHELSGLSIVRLLREGTQRRDLGGRVRSEEHTSELQSRGHVVCRLLLETKKWSSFREC